MASLRRRRRMPEGDQGVAILTVLLVLAVLGALSTTMAVVTINNAQNSSRDRQAGAALATADGGVAEAINYLRGTAGAAQALACAPACTNNDWGNAAAPHRVVIDANRNYLVHFERLTSLASADQTVVYRVHSQGYAGSGPGARKITIDLQYTPSSSYPIGIFARQFAAGGTADITNESVFSDGCVARRGNLNIAGMDAYYRVPAAVHSSGIITTANESCTTGSNSNIHRSSRCNATYPGDQDAQGGSLTSANTACYRYGANKAIPAGSPGSYLENSFLDAAGLRQQYNYRPGGLTPQELDTLKAAAKAQGNYHTQSCSTCWVQPNATTQPQAVLFFDLAGADVGSTVDLSALTGYSRPTGLQSTDPSCNAKQILIVILNGNARIQSNATFVTQLFVPTPGPASGTLTLRGGATILGTVYADNLDQSGNASYTLDDCFLKNLNGNSFSIVPTNYREVDR